MNILITHIRLFIYHFEIAQRDSEKKKVFKERNPLKSQNNNNNKKKIWCFLIYLEIRKISLELETSKYPEVVTDGLLFYIFLVAFLYQKTVYLLFLSISDYFFPSSAFHVSNNYTENLFKMTKCTKWGAYCLIF